MPVVALGPGSTSEAGATSVRPGAFLTMGSITTARWTRAGLPLSSLQAWAKERYGRFAVVERTADAARIAVRHGGAELWIWVDVDAADRVLVRAAKLRATKTGAPCAVLAGGTPVELVGDDGDALRVRLQLDVLSSHVELEGWVEAADVDRVFQLERPTAIRDDDHRLHMPMYQETLLLDGPSGAPCGKIHQGIWEFSVKPLGSATEGKQKIAFTVNDEDHHPVAQVTAYLDATLVKPSAPPPHDEVAVELAASGKGPTPRQPTPPAGWVRKGVCLVHEKGGAPIGRTTRAVRALRTEGRYRAIDVDGLTLWADPASGGDCTETAP
jgi:hypothetical protein